MNNAFGSLTTVALALAFALAGCASHRPASGAALPDARSVPIFRGSDGTKVEWGELVNSAAAADVVILGENHGHPLGLLIASALWGDIASRDDSNAALSLEFFERDQQSRVDDYLAGLTDEAAFRLKTARNAGNYPPGHREMLELARAKGLHVIASNAPGVYVKAARDKGFEAMQFYSQSQSRLFKIPDEIPRGHYRESFDQAMGDMPGHGAPDKGAKKEASATPEEQEARAAREKAQKQERLDAAYRGMCLWDWTMADSIAKARDAGDCPVVHVVGHFHCDFHGGLVQALEHYDEDLKITVVTFVDETSDVLKGADKSRGDFVIYVGPSKD